MYKEDLLGLLELAGAPFVGEWMRAPGTVRQPCILQEGGS